MNTDALRITDLMGNIKIKSEEIACFERQDAALSCAREIEDRPAVQERGWIGKE